jgi:hypothetical protein
MVGRAFTLQLRADIQRALPGAEVVFVGGTAGTDRSALRALLHAHIDPASPTLLTDGAYAWARRSSGFASQSDACGAVPVGTKPMHALCNEAHPNSVAAVMWPTSARVAEMIGAAESIAHRLAVAAAADDEPELPARTDEVAASWREITYSVGTRRSRPLFNASVWAQLGSAPYGQHQHAEENAPCRTTIPCVSAFDESEWDTYESVECAMLINATVWAQHERRRAARQRVLSDGLLRGCGDSPYSVRAAGMSRSSWQRPAVRWFSCCTASPTTSQPQHALTSAISVRHQQRPH